MNFLTTESAGTRDWLIEYKEENKTYSLVLFDASAPIR